MDTAFWKDKWEKMEIGFHQSDTHPLLMKHLPVLDLPQGARIFVPLCGKSLDMLWLSAQGYKVIGVELSEIAVDQFFSELEVTANVTQLDKLTCYSSLGIDIYLGDFFDLNAELLGNIDAIYDRASLVALPEHMRADYARHMIEITHRASQLLISFDYDQSVMTGPPFSVTEAMLRSYYEMHYSFCLLESVPVEGGLKGMCEATEQVWHLT